MSIENAEAYANSQPDWQKIFPQAGSNPRWRLSDMDGFGERNSQFLFLEWKGTGVAIDLATGQGLALTRLSENQDTHVMLIWGTAPNGPVTHMQRLGADENQVECDNDQHIHAYIDWYRWADDTDRTGDPWKES